MSRCGLRSISTWSLNVPGSLSSALQQMYFGFGVFLSTNCHFMPVGKPGAAAPAEAGLLHLVDDLRPASSPSALRSAS